MSIEDTKTLLSLAASLPRVKSRAQLESLSAGFAFDPVNMTPDDDLDEKEEEEGLRVREAYCTTLKRCRKNRGVESRRPSQDSKTRAKHKRSKSAIV